MNLLQRIEVLAKLGGYMQSDAPDWVEARQKAYIENGWFIPEFIDLAVNNIAQNFLQKNILENWVQQYPALQNISPKKAGLVMAGNIPLVGFHDFLCVFISGHHAVIKPATKDSVLIKHLINKMIEWQPELAASIQFAERLNGCDAYIATGSNNSAGFFEYYFAKYPHIIRRNRTSVAILTGNETDAELDALADDVFLYFGRGCRNVTKLYVPQEYNFEKLLQHFKKYNSLADNAKYKNNLDYNLALHLLNHRYYMSTPALLMVEDDNIFTPVSQLNYAYYKNLAEVPFVLNNDLQCIVGHGHTPFGTAQYPAVNDYADGLDTLAFLASI